MRLHDFYLDQQLEPDMPLHHETRALSHDHTTYEIDVEREADWRRMQEWQWREECAKKEDERIEKAAASKPSESGICPKTGRRCKYDVQMFVILLFELKKEK